MGRRSLIPERPEGARGPAPPEGPRESDLRLEESAQGITLQILVVPRASREAVGPVVGDRLKVAITAPPVEGKANAAVVALLARTLGVRRQQLEIVAGAKGKRKTVRVTGTTRQALLEALEPALEHR